MRFICCSMFIPSWDSVHCMSRFQFRRVVKSGTGLTVAKLVEKTNSERANEKKTETKQICSLTRAVSVMSTCLFFALATNLSQQYIRVRCHCFATIFFVCYGFAWFCFLIRFNTIPISKIDLTAANCYDIHTIRYSAIPYWQMIQCENAPSRTLNEELNSLITLWQWVSGRVSEWVSEGVCISCGAEREKSDVGKLTEKPYRNVARKKAFHFVWRKWVHTNQIRQFCCETNWAIHLKYHEQTNRAIVHRAFFSLLALTVRQSQSQSKCEKE